MFSFDIVSTTPRAKIWSNSNMASKVTSIPAFLDHYRKLGINQFAIVDNCSDDGSLDILVKQNDTFVFSTPNKYSRSMFGVKFWICFSKQTMHHICQERR